MILSNIPSPEYDIIRQNNLQNYFDEIVYSFDKGLVKPNLKLFNLVLSKLDAKCNEIIMIEDSLESDVEPARKLRLNTIHFKNVTQLKEELASFLDLV